MTGELRTVRDIKECVKGLIRTGRDENEMVNLIRLRVVDSNLEEKVIKEIVHDVVAQYPNYDLIQMIMKNKLVVDKDSKGKGDIIYIVSEEKGIISKISKVRLGELFFRPNFADKTYVAEFVYNPYNFNVLYKENGIWKFNTYEPPFWLSDYFYSSGDLKIEKVEKIPEIYKEFLMHLVDKDKASYNYILDWMANAIRNRNFCILTTIGNQGIGKGVLGDIMMRLVGDSNYTLTDNKLIQKDFNSQLKNKRIIHHDEILVKTASEINKFKSLINSTVEVEQKGMDAVTIENFASIYTSSNDLDAINLPGDDRRFSIVNLTDKKLKDCFKHKINDLLTEENIELFANYLWHRPIDEKKMLDVFISSRTEEIRAATLSTWADYLLDEYAVIYAGKQIEVKEVAKDIKEALDDYSIRLGRTAFQKLQNKYPEKFQIIRPSSKKGKARKYYIKFPRGGENE